MHLHRDAVMSFGKKISRPGRLQGHLKGVTVAVATHLTPSTVVGSTSDYRFHTSKLYKDILPTSTLNLMPVSGSVI